MATMTISLGHGIVFATAVTLVLVPSFYLIIEDFLSLQQRVRARLLGGRQPATGG